MRAFITGVTGQDGSYLAELLLEKGYSVAGLVRRSSINKLDRIRGILDNPHFELFNGDLSDFSSLEHIVRTFRPHEIYNLAAQSHVGVSFENPSYTVQVNNSGVINLLTIIKDSNRDIKFYQASSSEMYGDVLQTPQNEYTPFNPQSPYACSKVYGYYQTVNHRVAYDLFTCNGILFNHESPRRGDEFVTKKIVKAAVNIKNGKQKKLYLGNLDAKRDWGYAKEYVEAMWLMMQHDTPDDYVIATGKTYSVSDFLVMVFESLGMDWQDYVEIDSALYRPSDVNLLLGDATKAKTQLNWEPKVDIKELAAIMVEDELRNSK